MVCKSFFSFRGLSFHFLDRLLCFEKLFSFTWSDLIDFCLCCQCFGCHIKKNHYQHQCQGAFSCFLLGVYGFRSYLELIFVGDLMETQLFFYMWQLFPQHHSLKRLISPEHSWRPFQGLVDCRCEGLFLAFVHCCASNMLF